MHISVFQGFPSVLAARTFFNVLIKRSTSPLALGHNGVTFLCLNPNVWAKYLNYFPLYGGPLSDRTTSGIPNVVNALSSWGMTVAAAVDRTTSFTEYRE